jgi:hypothetical protein
MEGISDVQYDGRDWRNSANVYLRFRTPRALLLKLIGPGFHPISRDVFRRGTENAGIIGPTPSWWRPLAGSPTLLLYSTSFHPGGFSRGQAYVSYDDSTHVAHVYWDGIS